MDVRPAYYNEYDPFAAAWLRELIKEKLLPDGEVDTRSILDVRAEEIRGFGEYHFFAGIGGWALAFRIAGWPQGRLAVSASLPCQPLSSAGKRKGDADERHLWPAFHDLVAQLEFPEIFGEQVASADGREWLAGVRADLEGMGYAIGAADLCAAGVRAPHIRQRLYWVADSKNGDGRSRKRGPQAGTGARGIWGERSAGGGIDRGLADPTDGQLSQPGRGSEVRDGAGSISPDNSNGGVAHADGRDAIDGNLQRGRQHGQQPQDRGSDGGVGHALIAGLEGHAGHVADGDRPGWQGAHKAGPVAPASVLIPCSDGKWRRVPANEKAEPEPALFPLANAGTVRNRVGLLRGSGNAIVPALAAEFIKAFLEAEGAIS